MQIQNLKLFRKVNSDSVEDWEDWLNQMNKAEITIVTIPKKGQVKKSDQIVKQLNSQKSLGLVLTENLLTWTANANRQFSKAIRALWFLKEINQTKRHSLNGNKDYIVSIISYASDVWHPNKEELVLLKKLLKKATKWILGSSIDYKNKNLNILPLAMYLETQSLLIYFNVSDGENNININQFVKYITNQRTRQGTHEVIFANTRLCKSDENFWKRTAIIYFWKRTDLRSKLWVSHVYKKDVLQTLGFKVKDLV